MSSPAKLVLVTGGTGMVGSCIVQSLLSRGHRLRALVRSPDKGRALLPAAVFLHPSAVYGRRPPRRGLRARG